MPNTTNPALRSKGIIPTNWIFLVIFRQVSAPWFSDYSKRLVWADRRGGRIGDSVD
jgi:hypothetical protein